jgi:hypothetical protein
MMTGDGAYNAVFFDDRVAFERSLEEHLGHFNDLGVDFPIKIKSQSCHDYPSFSI